MVAKVVDKLLREVDSLPKAVREEGDREDLEKLLKIAEKVHEAIAELTDSVLIPNADYSDYHYYLFVSSLAKRGFLGRKAVWVVICDRELSCGPPCEGCKVFGNAVIIEDPNIGKEGFDRLTESIKKMLEKCGCGEVLIMRGVVK